MMHGPRPTDPDKPDGLKVQTGEDDWADSRTGEGAASALQSLKQMEKRRAKTQPSDERPSGD